MKKIEAYQTEDGKIFATDKDAIKHETKISCKKQIMTVLENSDLHFGFDSSTKLEVAQAILDNAKSIVNILNKCINAKKL